MRKYQMETEQSRDSRLVEDQAVSDYAAERACEM
jgi:hypothetical protein